MRAPISFEHFDARLDPATLAAVDEWRAGQCDLPARNDAIRRLIEAGLDSPRRIRLSDGEKLIVRMLGELLHGLKVESELKPAFIESVMAGGHYWALAWEHPGLFHRHEDSRCAVKEVVDILDMWTFLEEGLECLPAAERERIEDETLRLGGLMRFRGFDRNKESEHLNIARFLVADLGRFSRFRDRAGEITINPMLRSYRRMLGQFLPIRPKLDGRGLTSGEIGRILGGL